MSCAASARELGRLAKAMSLAVVTTDVEAGPRRPGVKVSNWEARAESWTAQKYGMPHLPRSNFASTELWMDEAFRPAECGQQGMAGAVALVCCPREEVQHGERAQLTSEIRYSPFARTILGAQSETVQLPARLKSGARTPSPRPGVDDSEVQEPRWTGW